MQYIGLFRWYLVISCAVVGAKWLFVILLVPVVGVLIALLVEHIGRKQNGRKRK